MTLGANSADKVVLIDCPDPDNVLMALWVLKHSLDSRVAIVLSVRPVSFKAAHYGVAYEGLLNAVGGAIHRMIDPLTEQTFPEAQQSWWKNLDKRDRAWFYVSPNLSDESVRQDTRTYMLVSALRMALFWRSHGIDSSRYRVYWDESSLSENTIKVGMAHAFHVHDWSFDFDKEETARYVQALKSISDAGGSIVTPFSDGYREQIHDICGAFARRVMQELSIDKALFDFNSLIRANTTAGVRADLFIGGPFADALTYIRGAPVNNIVAMGWNLQPGTTLFKLQFNVHVAPEAADAFLAHVLAHRLILSILPTECVKRTVYALTRDELLDVLGTSPAAVRLNLQYHETAAGGVQHTFALFDLVAAMTSRHPDLFPQIAVRAKQGAKAGEIDWIPDPDSTIHMLQPDTEHMKRMKPQFLDALRATVQ
jgi:hypothetical protein